MFGTLLRYAQALRDIADGEAHPADIAKAALAAEINPVEELAELLAKDPLKLNVELAELTTRQIREQQRHKNKAIGIEDFRRVGKDVDAGKIARWQMHVEEIDAKAAIAAGWVISPQWAEDDVDEFPPAQTAWLAELFSVQHDAARYIPKV